MEQAAALAVHRERVVGLLAHRVRQLVADVRRGIVVQDPEHRAGKARIAVVQEAEPPGPAGAVVDRGEAVQRDQDGRDARLRAGLQDALEGVVIRPEQRLDPGLARRRRDALVARDRGRIADRRDRRRHVGRPVAVDHEPRIALRDQRRLERRGQPAGDRLDPDVVGDVALEVLGCQAEVAERARHPAPGVIAGEHERRAAVRPLDVDGLRLIGLEQAHFRRLLSVRISGTDSMPMTGPRAKVSRARQPAVRSLQLEVSDAFARVICSASLRYSGAGPAVACAYARRWDAADTRSSDQNPGSKVRIARALAMAAAAPLLALGACAADDGADALPFAPGPGQGVFLIISDIHFDPFADPAIVEELVAADVDAWPGIFESSQAEGLRPVRQRLQLSADDVGARGGAGACCRGPISSSIPATTWPTSSRPSSSAYAGGGPEAFARLRDQDHDLRLGAAAGGLPGDAGLRHARQRRCDLRRLHDRAGAGVPRRRRRAVGRGQRAPGGVRRLRHRRLLRACRTRRSRVAT